MADITFKHVVKTYDKGNTVVPDLNLEIKDKEFVVLVGPSGCGKSTTLRMIAGLEEVSGGELYIGDRKVNDVPPKDRDIAMVFQSYALYPHMTVYKNMAFALELRKVPKDEIDKKVREAAKILGLEAAVQPGRQASYRDEKSDRSTSQTSADHICLCHSRSDRGYDHGRPDRSNERWGDSAV